MSIIDIICCVTKFFVIVMFIDGIMIFSHLHIDAHRFGFDGMRHYSEPWGADSESPILSNGSVSGKK